MCPMPWLRALAANVLPVNFGPLSVARRPDNRGTGALVEWWRHVLTADAVVHSDAALWLKSSATVRHFSARRSPGRPVSRSRRASRKGVPDHTLVLGAAQREPRKRKGPADAGPFNSLTLGGNTRSLAVHVSSVAVDCPGFALSP